VAAAQVHFDRDRLALDARGQVEAFQHPLEFCRQGLFLLDPRHGDVGKINR